ncbi:hypothetical protein OG871_02660 [Kitasatospora sp. NBC_00374]
MGISPVPSVIPVLVPAGAGMAAGAALVTLRKYLRVQQSGRPHGG